jgi:hypothetical protein
VEVVPDGRPAGRHRRDADLADLRTRLAPLLSAPQVRVGLAACMTCALGLAAVSESRDAGRAVPDAASVQSADAERAASAAREAASRGSARAREQAEAPPPAATPATTPTTPAAATPPPAKPKPSPSTARPKPKASTTSAKPKATRAAPVAGLSRAQMDNAATIVKVGVSMGLPRRGLIVAICTAMQESDLYNLASDVLPESFDYPHQGSGSDHDSVGLFQQRTSTGWGTVEELMTPATSARRFYEALLAVPGWEQLAITVAAQTVQVSAFPDAYAKHEERATTVVDALT